MKQIESFGTMVSSRVLYTGSPRLESPSRYKDQPWKYAKYSYCSLGEIRNT